jgi:type II secretory pathway component PulC
MIRSLIIRQVFRLLDMALVIGVLIVGFLVVKLFLTPLPSLDLNIAETAAAEETASATGSLGERAVYDGLVKSGMFGTAGRWDAQAPPEPEPEPEVSAEIEESALGLTLRGTVALEPGDRFSSAFIENTEKKDGVRTFLLGQEIAENVLLDTVLQREVILLNKRTTPPQRERLRMEEQPKTAPGAKPGAVAAASKGKPSAPAASSAPPASEGSTIQHTKLKRDAVIRDVMQNYATLSTITPEVKRDASGNVLGVTAPNIGQHPMAEKFGFKDGDVLQTINNERVESREALMEIMQRYQDASSFRVGILRDGRPNVLEFDIE